ncbi:DUF4845 domain-containing protein [Legionella sp. W05-934-2]|uniref:DUF4845 domain-containing protein n=1 Tax=Legionella sp. W05-934-2 TaxID=1198649 RepID=UPI0034633045
MRRMQGMTLTGMLVSAALVVIFAIFIMKVAPIYYNNYKVKNAVSALTNISSERFSHDMSYNSDQIRRILINQFYIDSVISIKPSNIVIKPINYNTFNIKIDYEVKEKMFANISLLVHFKVEQEVNINAP